MITFVLVHGTGHGGWCWQKVARHLSAGSCEVYSHVQKNPGDSGVAVVHIFRFEGDHIVEML